MTEACPFCNVPASRNMTLNSVGIAVLDAFPISNGHTLVIPKEHEQSIYELVEEDEAAVWRLVNQVRLRLLEDLRPDGFNISVNDGGSYVRRGRHGEQPRR